MAYMRLNAVRNRVLSRGTSLSGYQAKALRRFESLILGQRPVQRVLEIGSDVDGAVLRELAALGVAEVVGVNPDPAMWARWDGEEHRLDEHAILRRADASALPFEDAGFDAIFSVATFEHILNLRGALREMHRVLRPGGSVYSLFGPIWSGGRGHHIRVSVDGVEFRHFDPRLNPLPDFSHLLLGPDELREALAFRIPAQAVEPTVGWVFEDAGINRVFLYQYLDEFRGSQFSLESLRFERDPVDKQLLSVLSFRHPHETRFDVTNAEVVLRKSESG